jgi:deoxyribodipyrimidine photo-lyase
MSSQRAIWWIRRDLRLDDNPTLCSAISYADTILPVFILDPALLDSRWSGEKRVAFLLASLEKLNSDLEDRGSHLVIRTGNPLDVLKVLIREERIDRVYAEADVSPYAVSRDRSIRQELPLYLQSQPAVTHPDEVLKQDGAPYTMFTPYARRWKEIVTEPVRPLGAPGSISTPDVLTDRLPSSPVLPGSVPFEPGPDAAKQRLHSFSHGESAPIYSYSFRRDRVDLDGTSRLSPYLRFGMISARQAVAAAMEAITNAPDVEAAESANKWLDELVWREFYISILYHFPEVRSRSFREKYRQIEWINDPSDIEAWRRAETGYPLVDAAMRQLHAEGWMHNRARMIVASFLVKDLLVNWQIGEQHFMQHLIDGDPASNNGGWQWSAGTGTDAAPYFRIFNPVRQSERHDPNGTYIRLWIPELRHVPDRYLHEPWTMPEKAESDSDCVIGRDYPEPVVDHSFARRRALEHYKRG